MGKSNLLRIFVFVKCLEEIFCIVCLNCFLKIVGLRVGFYGVC